MDKTRYSSAPYGTLTELCSNRKISVWQTLIKTGSLPHKYNGNLTRDGMPRKRGKGKL